MEAGPSQQVVQLTEVDVPGALLEEPMDKHSIPDGGCYVMALKCQVLCVKDNYWIGKYNPNYLHVNYAYMYKY